MKTSKGKKALSVFLAVVMIMTSCITVSPAFAVDDSCSASTNGEHNFTTEKMVEVSCTSDGYTLMSCACGAQYKTDIVPATGHKNFQPIEKEPTCTEIGGSGYICTDCEYIDYKKETIKEALGHDMSAWYFMPQENGKYYYHMRNCGRDGCDYTEYEYLDEASTDKAIYYKVDYVNEWKATDFYTTEDGTSLAYPDEDKATKYTSSTVTVYVKSGEEAVYGEATPVRAKTKAYGRYEFTGWDKASELKSVTKNITTTAQFKGVSVTYYVNFGSAYTSTKPNEGEIIKQTYQYVAHGETIQFNPAQYCIPQHPNKSNPNYNYCFNGWNLKYCPDYEKPLVDDESKDYTYGDAIKEVEIYQNHEITAKYEATPKHYKVIFHDEYGNVIYNGEENGVIFEYGKTPSFVPEIVLKNSVAEDTDPNDFYDCKSYYYSFGLKNGKEMRWKDKNGEAVDVNSLIVPSGTAEYDPESEKIEYLEDEDKGIIHLYPNIIHNAKTYTMKLVVMDIDGETPAEGATVTISDIVADNEANHLIGSPYTLDEHGSTILSLPYGESKGGQLGIAVYNINVSLNGRKAIGVITDTHMAKAVEGETPIIELKLVEPEGDEATTGCTCICHSFLGNIYITFLNVVYRLFGIKIVCCYDMYARHGDKLVYTRDN